MVTPAGRSANRIGRIARITAGNRSAGPALAAFFHVVADKIVFKTDHPNSSAHSVDDAAQARRRYLARSAWLTIPGTPAIIATAYALTPPIDGLVQATERLIFSLRWLAIAFLPYAAVCLLILHKRYFEGAHNPLVGAESMRLQVHCRVMQNTLEQFVWFAVCVLPLATYLSPSQARLVPILTVFFAAARFIYWWGYLHGGTLARAPGVQLTFSLNISLLVAVLAFLARGRPS
jgi:uncharacterized membrane protein YecN with MAPEG domain